MHCNLCNIEIDNVIMGGVVGELHGKVIAFCQWCDMRLTDILKAGGIEYNELPFIQDK
tara:strand:- start:874 stop:1047 length:174 start_codon:yes stop_codon:yes gene_type:complete